MRRIPGLLLTAAWVAALSAGSLPEGADPAVSSEAKIVRTTRLQGAAHLGRNRHVVGATVLVRATDESARFHVTATDLKGRFRVDGLPDGDYRVEIRREGLATVVKEHVGVRFPSRAVIEVTMHPVDRAAAAAATPVALDATSGFAIRGRVVEREGGAAMAEVALRFARPDGLADPVVVRTGADGGFELGGLRGGRWRLESRVVGFLPIWASVGFEEDTELTISMVSQPAGYQPSPLELMPPERPIPPAARPRVERPAEPVEETIADPSAEMAELPQAEPTDR